MGDWPAELMPGSAMGRWTVAPTGGIFNAGAANAGTVGAHSAGGPGGTLALWASAGVPRPARFAGAGVMWDERILMCKWVRGNFSACSAGVLRTPGHRDGGPYRVHI